MNEDIAKHLEDDGWEIIRREPFEARRDRGDQCEILFVAEDGRLRYTRTRLVGEEHFSLVHAGANECRVVSRTEDETTVTTNAIDGRIAEAIAAALTPADI